MKLFGQIVGIVVETVKLPACMIVDAVFLIEDGEDKAVGHRTADCLDKIKAAAQENGKNL